MSQYYNTSLKNLVHRLRKLKEILNEELTDEIMANEDIIIEMIHDQLYSGLDGYTRSIHPPYAPRTIKRKLRKGQPTDRVTLRDTGEFYKSLHVAYDGDGFYIASNDRELSDILKARYGEPILRLSNENLTFLLRTFIRPSLKEKLKNRILNDRA